MYERELKLITEQSSSEIDGLTKQLDHYKRREQDIKLNQQINGELEATQQSRTKEILITTKQELEQAARTIKELNNELMV